MTDKTTKAELLQKAIDEVLFSKDVVDGEFGASDNEGVALWILKKYGENHVIFCWHFDWCEKTQSWIEKPISEVEGPAMLNCPIRFFNHKFETDEIFEQWRYEVKKYHEQINPPVQDNAVAFRLLNSLTDKNE